MLYYPHTSATVNPATITGSELAYNLRGRSATGRAIIAAALRDGLLIPTGFTFRQAAALCGASPTYVFAASLLDDEARQAVIAGRRPLVDPQRQLENCIRRAGIETAWGVLVRILDEVK